MKISEMLVQGLLHQLINFQIFPIILSVSYERSKLADWTFSLCDVEMRDERCCGWKSGSASLRRVKYSADRLLARSFSGLAPDATRPNGRRCRPFCLTKYLFGGFFHLKMRATFAGSPNFFIWILFEVIFYLNSFWVFVLFRQLSILGKTL